MSELELIQRAAAMTHYDRETGIITWKPRPGTDWHTRSWNTRYANNPAGCDFNGYVRIQLREPGNRPNKLRVMAHRLAWFVLYGKLPEGEIDHADRNRANNRPGNLRDVTHGENMKNLPFRSDNKSGVAGVYWSEPAQRWIAEGFIDGRKKYLGRHKKLGDAEAAVTAFRAANGFHDNHRRAV